jgi:serine/threonine-protein kinase ULK/ATG1
MIELLQRQKFQVKIADLGFSKQLRSLDEDVYSYCGTPLNMAPEVMNGDAYSYKADLWSVGVCLFHLLTGVFPFFGLSKPDLFRNVNQGLYLLNRHLTISPLCLDFINRCLQFDSRKRFTWPQIEAHPFFNHKEYYRVIEKVSFAMNVDNDG